MWHKTEVLCNNVKVQYKVQSSFNLIQVSLITVVKLKANQEGIYSTSFTVLKSHSLKESVTPVLRLVNI
jgi:hypothetical protein